MGTLAGRLVILAAGLLALATLAAPQDLAREVLPGLATARPIPGLPLQLAGKRIVFTDWSFVQPGDLDWVNAAGVSVYVSGDEAVDAARHVGINAPRGIRIAARKPQVIGPLFRPHRCIIQDGALYRGWTDNEYYESADGMEWTKKANLVFDREEDGIHHIFIDPLAPPAERFKSVWSSDSLTLDQLADYRRTRPDDWEPRALLHAAETGKVSCIRGSVSADGITWKTLPEPLVVEYADTLNTATYDRALGKYVLYTRCWTIRPYATGLPVDIRHSWTGAGRRAIGRSESADFRRFAPSRVVLEPSPSMLPSEALYTNCYTTIPGAPDQHLMFPAIWNASVSDTTRLALASSSDGVVWNWVPGGELLETADFGAWNGGCIWAEPNLFELPNGDWALPYSAHNVPHKYPRGQRVGGLGYAIWPRGRMVALEAPDRGEFTMMTVIAPGATLEVNVVTRRAGSLRVEVVGDPERTFDRCTPLVGDRHWAAVSWGDRADTGRAPGEPLTLRFRLDQAELYGVQFE